MLNTRQWSGLVWALLLCLVLVNGFMAAPSVAHAAHHATHQANTHATGICAWLCTAGQGLESPSVIFESVLQVVGRAGDVPADRATFHAPAILFLRGPPARPR